MSSDSIGADMTRAHHEEPTAPSSIDASGDLWMVQAVIQPFKLDQVTRALHAVEGFSGMTVTGGRGFGRVKVTEPAPMGTAHRPREVLDELTNKIRIDIVVAGRPLADDVTAAIARAAHTGNAGDGKIFVWPLSRVVRVRTMEEGRDAL